MVLIDNKKEYNALLVDDGTLDTVIMITGDHGAREYRFCSDDVERDQTGTLLPSEFNRLAQDALESYIEEFEY